MTAGQRVRMKNRTPNYDAGQTGVLGRPNRGDPGLRWIEFGVERHGSTGCWCGPGEYELLPGNGSPLMPGLKCLGCGYRLDDSTTVGGKATPGPGDVSICFKCGHLGVYITASVGFSLRNPTDAEKEQLLNDPRVLCAITAIIALRESTNPNAGA